MRKITLLRLRRKRLVSRDVQPFQPRTGEGPWTDQDARGRHLLQ